ncbi:MAG: hypothetical protein EHM24_25320, partial [Acidobacteria bacterium]
MRLLLEAYRDADLARAAAAIIRGWADEEPRALWERLRAEGPPRGVDAGEVARWALVTARTHQGGGGFAPEFYDDPGRTGWPGAGPPRMVLASRIEEFNALPATITPDARRVDPREVARWMTLWPWCYRQGDWTSGGPVLPGDRRQNTTATATATKLAGMGLPATITPDARGIEPGPDLPPGTVAYMD